MVKILLLDALAKNRRWRISTCGYDFEELMNDFSEWMKEKELLPEEIKYANIFDVTNKGKPRHIAEFILNDDQDLEVVGIGNKRAKLFRFWPIGFVLYRR